MLGPITLPPGSYTGGPQCPREIGFELGKHTFGLYVSPDHGVNMRTANMHRMRNPSPILANHENRVQAEKATLPVQDKRNFGQARSPISLPFWIVWLQRAAWNAVLSIHPSVFRSRKMRAITGKSQHISQCAHIRSVPARSSKFHEIRNRAGSVSDLISPICYFEIL